MVNSFLTLLPWIIAILGPVIASYFTAKVMRDTEVTNAHGERSVCDTCGHQLSALDLIPILSFALLRGKCRYCGAKISWKIFATEVLGLTLYAVLGWGISQYMVSGSNLQTVIYSVIGFVVLTVLFYLAIYDGFTYTIPTRGVQIGLTIVIVINVIALIVNMLNPTLFGGLAIGRWDNLLAGLGFGLFFQLIIILTKQRGMGVGDVVVAVIMGFALGWPSVITAFYGLIFSAAVAGIIVSVRRKKFHGSVLPLVPFMTLGFVVAYVWGVPIFNLLFRI